MPIPALVTLHVWGVAPRRVPAALGRVARDRRPLRATAGLSFGKLLGTGDGRTFTLRDADPRHWAVLAAWDDTDAAAEFERSQIVARWDRSAEERLRVAMHPLSSRGRWSRRAPFGDPAPRPYAGVVAAVTRARLRPSRAVTFWHAVPPVSAAVRTSIGLRLALGIGEAPIGVQGTFSLWDSPRALLDFAARDPAHADAVRRTAEVGWYAEELFARFAVEEVEGTYRGRRP